MVEFSKQVVLALGKVEEAGDCKACIVLAARSSAEFSDPTVNVRRGGIDHFSRKSGHELLQELFGISEVIRT